MWYSRHADSITLSVYVQPGAKVSEIAGFYGEALKIKLKAPAIEGKANEALQHYLAQLFKVPLKHVKLVRGGKSRHKLVEISQSSVNPEQLLR